MLHTIDELNIHSVLMTLIELVTTCLLYMAYDRV
jgi:hypothetical protein